MFFIMTVMMMMMMMMMMVMQQNQTCFHHGHDAASSIHITFISPSPPTIIIIKILKSEKEIHIVLPRLISYQWYHQCLVEKVNLTITIVTIIRFNFYPPEPKDEVQTGIGTPATTSCCPHRPSRAGRQEKDVGKVQLGHLHHHHHQLSPPSSIWAVALPRGWREKVRLISCEPQFDADVIRICQLSL